MQGARVAFPTFFLWRFDSGESSRPMPAVQGCRGLRFQHVCFGGLIRESLLRHRARRVVCRQACGVARPPALFLCPPATLLAARACYFRVRGRAYGDMWVRYLACSCVSSSQTCTCAFRFWLGKILESWRGHWWRPPLLPLGPL